VTTQLEIAVADLLGELGDAERMDARLAALPITKVTALALFLAQREKVHATAAASHILDLLLPLAGEELQLDDNLGRLALAVGRVDEAITLLDDRLARSEALSAYQLLARAYLAQQRQDDARALVERAVEPGDSRIGAWQWRGEVLLALGDLTEALAAYHHALQLAPGATNALLGLARCQAILSANGNQEFGEAADARALVERVFAVYQGTPPAWVLREIIEIARALDDAAWLDELAETLAEKEAREAESWLALLRSGDQSATALDGQEGKRRRAFADQPLATAQRGRLTRIAGATDAGADDTDDGEESEDDGEPEPATAEIEEEPAAPELLEALRDHFGYESFLPGQATIISAVLRGEDVLALMPTGAGKSLCYQLPALLLPGTTVLISPLIALMKDQMEGLPAAVREQTTIINSMIERDELERRLMDIAAGRYKLVYAAPERLRQQSFIYALRRAGVARFVVDEAHCVSLWGHDFRPDYLFIAKALRQLASDGVTTPVLALTATATPEVRDGIAAALERDLRVINRGVFRANLRYEVIRVHNSEDRLRALAEIVRQETGAGIVYVRSRDGCEEVAEFLRRRCGVSAQHYHAGMERGEREAAQDDFIGGRTRVIVATVAFGMGIDKPDVRFIVHYQLPNSLEAYVQESGRAGRDGKPSRCILLASSADVAQVRRHIRQDELSIETLRAVYAAAQRLIRAGAPAGSAIGRVGAADLEREISAAIEAAQAADERSGKRQVNETGTRVALSLLERAGFLLRHADVPRAPLVRLGSPAPADEMDESDAARFAAFVAAAQLQPGLPQTLDLLELAARLGWTPAMLEDSLLGWRDAGLLDYRDSPRDLALERCAPPADGKTAMPELLAGLGERHERQIASLVTYMRAQTCRQRIIARHFEERLPVRTCGVCDVCSDTNGEGHTTARSGERRPRPPRIRDTEVMRAAVLACLRELPYAVGVKGLILILTGSTNTAASAQRIPSFGALAGASKAALTREIQAMIAEGLLARDDTAEYPTLRLCARDES
jgi:ATP-dependent DNA helicase RecQ